MQQIQIPIANLPIALICISNGQIAFVKTSPFTVIYDQPEEGISATITPDNLLVGNEKYEYNRAYSLQGEVKKWIVQQKLENPF